MLVQLALALYVSGLGLGLGLLALALALTPLALLTSLHTVCDLPTHVVFYFTFSLF